MFDGALLTKITIWFALAGYVAGVAFMLIARERDSLRRVARNVWTIGYAFFLAHVFCAFNYYYLWSHSIAYTETARQTAEVMGEPYGGGVFVGYVFTLLWLADVIWWWLSPQTHKQRPRILSVAFHAFLFFVIFNGTVVFKHGMTRIIGIIVFLALACLWLMKRNAKSRKGLVEIGG